MDFDIGEPSQPSQVWRLDWIDVISASVGLALAMGVLLWLYHSIQRPRLYLLNHPDQPPVAPWQAVVRYIVLTPIVVSIWFMALFLILTMATSQRDADTIALSAAVVIGAGRLLAHANREASHELAKAVPLTVLSLLLISGTATDEQRLDNVFGEFEANVAVVDSFIYSLIVFDFVITAVWYWRQRNLWSGRQPGSRRTRMWINLAPLTITLRRIWNFGRTDGTVLLKGTRR